MLEFEELKLRLAALEPQIEDLKDALGLEQCKVEVRRLEAQQEDPNFWNDVETSTKVQRKLSQLNGKINSHKDLETRYEDTMTLIEIALEENDPSLYDEALPEVEKLDQDIDELKLTTLLTGEYDDKNAIITFHAGAG
ncbi:MAG: PCRF domain-containing protein, partial [Oscillospiraceae bacterium]|nr:PCRF domain-containing protein [Oscillospiraceae bacterium]